MKILQAAALAAIVAIATALGFVAGTGQAARPAPPAVTADSLMVAYEAANGPTVLPLAKLSREVSWTRFFGEEVLAGNLGELRDQVERLEAHMAELQQRPLIAQCAINTVAP